MMNCYLLTQTAQLMKQNQFNKKVIGKMKGMSEGKIIDEFVELKSKMYSMKNIDGK